MKYILSLIFLGFLFTGCANKASVSCPSCTISMDGNSTKMECTECKVEAQASEMKDIGILPIIIDRGN